MTIRSVFFFSACAMCATAAHAGSVEFIDPKGDDNGPGTYTYPTDPAYKKGSFDVVGVKVRDKGANVEITIQLAAAVEDPWDSKKWPDPGWGFSLQQFQIYVDTDGKAGSGEADGLPGTNVTFADDSRYEHVLIVGPHSPKTFQGEIDRKAAKFKQRVILPKTVEVRGKEVTAIFPKANIPFDPAKVGWQVLVASEEGYPKDNDILMRRVNEFEGPHRFGGGDDGMTDPHVIDILAGKAKGDASEVAAQHAQLKYDAKANKKAVLTMVRP